MVTGSECVGFLELGTIAKGIQVTDALLKKASVKMLFAYPVSSGKYLTCFYGTVDDVKSSVAIGKETAGAALLDSFLLPAIHPGIVPAIQEKSRLSPTMLQGLGILETVTCAACVVAADIALKTSKVRLLKIQLAKGIGGKAYFILEGEVGALQAAMSAGLRLLQKQGAGVIDHVIIPQATQELLTLFN